MDTFHLNTLDLASDTPLRTYKLRFINEDYMTEFFTFINEVIVHKYDRCIDLQKNYYFNMPEFTCPKYPYIIVAIYHPQDLDILKLYYGIQGGSGLWFPHSPHTHEDLCWVSHSKQKPKYPIYIVSHKRANPTIGTTATLLKEMKIDFKIVIRQECLEEYLNHYNMDTLLVMPKDFDNNAPNLYDGQPLIEHLKGNGASIPQRNYAWFHAIQSGATHHWILDDNIRGFFRRQDGLYLRIKSPIMFVSLENYLDMTDNCFLLGIAMKNFCPSIGNDRNPIVWNGTCIYSCILINHCELTKRNIKWRGWYNEDVDLALQVLKQNLPTIQLCTFTYIKPTSGQTQGGNQNIYMYEDGWLKKYSAIKHLYPREVSEKEVAGHISHNVKYKVDVEPIFNTRNTSTNNYGLYKINHSSL